jgi:hypothetical protein
MEKFMTKRGYQETPSSLIIAITIGALAHVTRGWCQNAISRDINGHELEDSTSPKAVAWCLCSAISRACSAFNADTYYDGDYESPYMETCNFIANTCSGGDGTLIDINDTDGQTQENIINIIGGALVRAGEKIG